MNSITVGNTIIKYDIIRSNRKTIGITVDHKKGVIVRSPSKLSDETIRDLVRHKSGWILEKLDMVSQIKPEPRPKEFLSGEKLPYLGRKYRLKVIEDPEANEVKVQLYHGKFYIRVRADITGRERSQLIRQHLIKWYREHADSRIRERVEYYQNKIGITPNSINVKKQEKRWGSCSSKGNLNFNWKLIMAPMAIIDYIVVHELVHLVHPNHSKKFWSMVEFIISDYKERQEWLRINGNLLYI